MTAWLRVRLFLDRGVALILLALSAPVILVGMVLVRRHDGGPGLIAVPRVGRNGQPIRMWKLRSMRSEADGGMANGVTLTSAGDRRITPIGARLRTYHIDELPQLFNVVRGDMCLLGPRPEAPAFVDLADPGWRTVLAVPPGIAGPTQLIVGAWETERITADPIGQVYVHEVLPVKLALDAWYLRRASVALDALVMVALVGKLLHGTGSQRLEARVRREVPAMAAVRP